MNRSPEALYRAHGSHLFRFLVRHTGDSDLAADVLHDTFQRLMERPPAPTGSTRGWLYRVAVNRLRDIQRKRSRRSRLTTEAAARRILGDEAPSPARTVSTVDASRRARRILDALSARDRALLLMREDGFTHREMAEAVGTTTGSVGTMVARALTKVRTALEEEAAPTEEVPCR